ncbi:MAG: CRISPR-associated endonuclease Cas2 [Candidatus Nealsonbacteria bacterium]|nr:MAG: CRISPR-associated endonuclease Cas2 [Candidatus Nealsonbacteria bacterium]
MSPTKQKILLLLLSGVALGCSYTLHKQYKVFKSLSREWKKIDRKKLREEIRNLYRSHLVTIKENADGSFTYLLTDKGKLKALTYHFQNIKIERNNWDGRWRIVVFDIPEKLKQARNAFRDKLKELGFYELQKSVFVFPYECQNEIEFVIEFFNLRKFVRWGTLDSIDNELHLRKLFNLN